MRTVAGAMGSFVTNGYPRLANPSRPCSSFPASIAAGQLFQLTESLAVDCSGSRTFSKGACFPACADFYGGSLQCSKDFPRNLNAGSWSLPIPKIGISLSVDDLVSYARSNDSNRFLELPGKNKNSEGGDVGPTPGWHNWDVAQWAYPFTSTSTTAEFWIYCTQQWGRVIDGSSLAAGEGGDADSQATPSAPQNVRATAAADGGIDVTWEPPASRPATQLAGYYAWLNAWKPGEPKVFVQQALIPLGTTGLSGRIPAGYLNLVRQTLPAGWETYVVVGAFARDGNLGELATISWPLR